MELEYISLSEFLNNSIYLQKGDYLYKHNKDEYPLKKDYDISNLFFVIENNQHKLKVHNMSNNNVINMDLSSTSEHWWILALPNSVRKQIGLDRIN